MVSVASGSADRGSIHEARTSSERLLRFTLVLEQVLNWPENTRSNLAWRLPLAGAPEMPFLPEFAQTSNVWLDQCLLQIHLHAYT